MLWGIYHEELAPIAAKGYFSLPDIPEYATNNAHMFYIVCRNIDERSTLISFLKDNGIQACFHYLALHRSEYYTTHYTERPKLPNCDRFADCLVRMPMYYELKEDEVKYITDKIKDFYSGIL